MSEWGNPTGVILLSWTEYIGPEKQTWRTETSKYPQEKKSTEISLVAASEREGACNTKLFDPIRMSWKAQPKKVIALYFKGENMGVRKVGRGTRNPD